MSAKPLIRSASRHRRWGLFFSSGRESKSKMNSPKQPAANAQEQLLKVTSQFISAAPHWVILVGMVVGFLYFLERKDERAVHMYQSNELVATERISACHDVQERAIVVMAELTSAITRHDHTIDNLQNEVERIGRALDRYIGVAPRKAD